jgi:hypothetical protein
MADFKGVSMAKEENGRGDGGPAFPSGGAMSGRVGLSKREYFAGQALAGLVAAPRGAGESMLDTPFVLARRARESADALVEELASREQGQSAEWVEPTQPGEPADPLRQWTMLVRATALWDTIDRRRVVIMNRFDLTPADQRELTTLSQVLDWMVHLGLRRRVE